MHMKQIIVVRHDLHMRMGKAIAQGAHASMMFLVQRLFDGRSAAPEDTEHVEWLLQGGMKKVCVRVESEDELLAIERKAREAGLPVFIVTDAGHTEFHGEPTRTCLAIGPAAEERIDPITGHLKLL